MLSIEEHLAVVFEVCGGGDLSPRAAQLILEVLGRYPEEAVHLALERCMMEVRGRLTLADVVQRIKDEHPGPEEAWAMLPKDQDTNAVITTVMQSAMGPALDLIDAGDHVAARMAFIETYKQALAAARAAGGRVRWVLTYGNKKAGLEDCLKQAAEEGKLSYAMALSYAPQSEGLRELACQEEDRERRLLEAQRQPRQLEGPRDPLLGMEGDEP